MIGLLKWLCAIILPIFTSCILCGPNTIELNEVWEVRNNGSFDIVTVTCVPGRNRVCPVDFVEAVKWIDSDSMALFKEQMIWMPLREHRETENQIRIYFVLGNNKIKDSLNNVNWLNPPYSEMTSLTEKAVAYHEVSVNWLLNHNQIINFPEDCTVNPRLHEIYNLDEFVEKYGPLKAKGWDEAWAKWLEAKQANTEQ